MSIRPARIRAIVVAVLVLAFAIPWTYAHIAYAWAWKEKNRGRRLPRSLLRHPNTTSNDPFPWAPSPMDVRFTWAAREKSPWDAKSLLSDCPSVPTLIAPTPSAGQKGLHRGDSATVEGVGTFTLKEAHSDIVWFTPNPGKATFCFNPDPSFTVREEP